MNAQTPLEEFDRQVQTLIRLGYPAIARMSADAFTVCLQPFKRLLEGAPSQLPSEDGRVPFVIVIPREWVPLEEAMALTQLKDKTGYIDFRPGGLETFKPLPDLEVPEGHAYLAFDLDTGSDLRNLPPDEALDEISSRRRTPLTLEEGIALLTHFPEKLKKNHCYSLAGSRSGDRRVPALWISQNRPRLGWCWAGNPHTWLGTASCGGRGKE